LGPQKVVQVFRQLGDCFSIYSRPCGNYKLDQVT